MDFAEWFGLVEMIFLIYAAVLVFFLAVCGLGIFNQSKEINNKLETMNENLQTMKSLLAIAANKNLDKGTSSIEV